MVSAKADVNSGSFSTDTPRIDSWLMSAPVRKRPAGQSYERWGGRPGPGIDLGGVRRFHAAPVRRRLQVKGSYWGQSSPRRHDCPLHLLK